MEPKIFWLLNCCIGDDYIKSDNMLLCQVYKDRIQVFDDEEQVVEISLSNIKQVKIDFKISFTAYWTYVELTFKNSNEKILLEPANPVYPNVKSNISLTESRKLRDVINCHITGRPVNFPSNPYLRNKKSFKSVENLNEDELNLHPYEFYEKFIKTGHRTKIIIIFIIFVLMNSIALIYNYFINR